ncbi:MAG TPA: cupredoxin domain-containing protein [Sphingomicrobium sp.]|nr:cupredoxin domain-containing protein [Sphingomicrobium sp.]
MKICHALASATLALGAPVAAQKPTKVVPVILYSFGYAPGPIALTAGEPVTMVFSNRSGTGHEFKAPEFFAASRILSGDAAESEIGMEPGQSKSVTLVPSRGTYRVHCGHFFHTQLGMHTTIFVR